MASRLFTEKSPAALTSFDTGLTIAKVRTASIGGEDHIIASSYEGTILAFGYDGENPLEISQRTKSPCIQSALSIVAILPISHAVVST